MPCFVEFVLKNSGQSKILFELARIFGLMMLGNQRTYKPHELLKAMNALDIA